MTNSLPLKTAKNHLKSDQYIVYLNLDNALELRDEFRNANLPAARQVKSEVGS